MWPVTAITTPFPPPALLAVELALLVPVGLVDKLWYDTICLATEGIALYFLISSIWFWVRVDNA